MLFLRALSFSFLDFARADQGPSHARRVKNTDSTNACKHSLCWTQMICHMAMHGLQISRVENCGQNNVIQGRWQFSNFHFGYIFTCSRFPAPLAMPSIFSFLSFLSFLNHSEVGSDHVNDQHGTTQFNYMTKKDGMICWERTQSAYNRYSL